MARRKLVKYQVLQLCLLSFTTINSAVLSIRSNSAFQRVGFQGKRPTCAGYRRTMDKSKRRQHAFTLMAEKSSLPVGTDVIPKESEFLNLINSHHSGDWAGQLSKFNSKDGTLIPVPEDLVPVDMVEWGQIPPQLEVLTSEEKIVAPRDNVGEKHGGTFELERTSVTVLPEVGCGCDNLATSKTKEILPMKLASAGTPTGFSDGKNDYGIMCAFDDGKLAFAHQKFFWKNTNKNKCQIVCQFPSMNRSNIVEKHYDSVRTRVSFDVELVNDDESPSICSPISIVKERRTSKESSQGTIADGGGLDAQTVAKLVGMDAINKPFAIRTENDLTTFSSDSANNDKATLLVLPGGVTIKYGITLDNSCIFSIEVSVKADDGNLISTLIVHLYFGAKNEGTTMQCSFVES